MAKKDDKQPETQAQGGGAAEVSLLDTIIVKGRMARDDEQRPPAGRGAGDP